MIKKVLEIFENMMYIKIIEIIEIIENIEIIDLSWKEIYIMKLAKISSKGLVNVPVEIRKILGVELGDQIAFIEKDGAVMIVKADNINGIARCQKYLEEFKKYEK